MPKLKTPKVKRKTKSTLKKRAKMTAGGLVQVRRQGHNHLLRKRAKRSLRAGRKVQYVDKNMQKQIKILAPYGLLD